MCKLIEKKEHPCWLHANQHTVNTAFRWFGVFFGLLFLQISHKCDTLISFLSDSLLERNPYVANKVLLSVSSKFSGDLKPSFYSFSCYGYLQQGSWLEAAINSVLWSLWQNCQRTDDLKANDVCRQTYRWIDARTHTFTHTCSGVGCYDDRRTEMNVISFSTIQKPVSSSIYLRQQGRRNVWNQFCI